MYAVRVEHNVRIPVRDGLELSANLFLPEPTTDGERFPAILEMIPYRKDDWRYATDLSRMSYLAQHGFACCRLDVRGTGSSPGIALDEYTPAETRDGYDAVEWLAAQPWCNGNVGMWGISYGGFTAIQVAMLQPPHLKAIFPVYATDDRYTDDVHYIGGCLVVSELAQYAVSQVAMNALPPKPEYAGSDWAQQWRARLEQTPPWTLEWLRRQTDGPYWRQGSLAPDYERITCAIYHVGGWNDGYTNAVLRMQERCTAAPRKALIGNWVHSLPDHAYPGPNLDWLHELMRFFGYWLKGEANGIMDEPPFTFFRREYTAPEAFPPAFNGAWVSAADYPVAGTEEAIFYLDDGTLHSELPATGRVDHYPHRPTLGTRGSLCCGGGMGPNGLARDLRPDEALSLTYTSAPLDAPLDVMGFPEAVLHLRCTAPVAHVVVRLTDVAPDGTSSQVAIGILNLTHRAGHENPAPLTPGEVYTVRVPLKATGYRFLPGQRIRLSVASAAWPIVWPSPYPADNFLHTGPQTPSRLLLPVLPPAAALLPPSAFKTEIPTLPEVGEWRGEPPVWEITEDVLRGAVTVRVRDGDETTLPDGTVIFTAEELEMTARHDDPAHVLLLNRVVYRLVEHGYAIEVRADGGFRSTVDAIHFDVRLEVLLNGSRFFERSWLESVPRRLV